MRCSIQAEMDGTNMRKRKRWAVDEIPTDPHYELSVPQVAALLRRSEAAVRKLMQDGLLGWWRKDPNDHDSDMVTTRQCLSAYQQVQRERSMVESCDLRVRKPARTVSRKIQRGTSTASADGKRIPKTQKEFSATYLR